MGELGNSGCGPIGWNEAIKLAGAMGLEPATTGSTVRCRMLEWAFYLMFLKFLGGVKQGEAG